MKMLHTMGSTECAQNRSIYARTGTYPVSESRDINPRKGRAELKNYFLKIRENNFL